MSLMPRLSAYVRPWLIGAAIFVAAPPAFAQPAAATPSGAASESVAIPDEALPARAEAALNEGLELESLRRWSDAVAHYEQVLREHPSDKRLKRRFGIARLHSNLARRYADSSFVETLQALDSQAALELHSELLSKIESHYVITPPWTEITRHGALACLIASRETAFQTQHGVRPSAETIEAFRRELGAKLSAAGEVRNAREALRLSADLAALGQQRIGAPTRAWTMEFVAAAAGGLDNYSAFLTPGQLRDVYSQIEGNFVGLGVELKADDGALLIVRVIPGSPAERAGMSAGDRITAVDGQQTSALSTDEAASLLTGEEGSFALVTLQPAGSAAASDFAADDLAHLVAKPVVRTVRVRREHVEVPSIENARIVDPDYGVAYIRIPVFQKSTARDVETALWDLHRQQMRTLVIDLRGNPGGLLTAAVELADKFIAQGNLVSTRGRSEGEDFDYRAHRPGTWRVPLVVLIDGDSASASEIFAAAIRDNRRGTIVGNRSFGKGSVQGIFPMTRSGAGVRLTTAKFYSPLGKPISTVGVAPDVPVVAQTAETPATRRTVGFRGAQSPSESSDRALDRAVEVARQQVAMR